MKKTLFMIILLSLSVALLSCVSTNDQSQISEHEDAGSKPDKIIYSEKLSIWPKQDGTYYVANLGYCKDSVIIVPPISPEGGTVTALENFHISQYPFVTGLIIPDTILRIGGIFNGVEEFNFNEYNGGYYIGTLSNPYYAFIRPASKDLTLCQLHPNTKIIAGEAFADCEALTEVVLPDGLISVCHNAFDNCRTLSKIQLPDSLVHLGSIVFRECDTLTEIRIPDGVTEIGTSTFYECSGLANVTIGSNVTEIGSNAFYNCISLTEIKIPDKVKSIGNQAFYHCHKLKTAVIGNGVTRIENDAFIDCTALINLEIGENVHTIMNGAFKNCDSLTIVHIPDSVKFIGKEAFAYCDSIITVYLGAGIETVMQYAFSYDPALTDVYFPGSEDEYRAIVEIYNFVDTNKHFNYR